MQKIQRIIALISVILLQACGGGLTGDVDISHPTQQAPTTAPNIVLEKNNLNQLILNWEEQSNAQNYTLYLSKLNTFGASKTSEIILNKPPYIIVAENTHQQYVVKLRSNWSGNESPDSNQLTFTAPPMEPSNLTSVVTDKNFVLVSWESVEALDSYTLYRSTSDVLDINTATVINNVTSPYRDDVVIPNQSYYYWLAAKRGDQYSAYSTTSSATVSEPFVENQAPVLISSTDFSVVENSTAITTIQASDADSSELAFLIIGGADVNLFALNRNGALIFLNPPDFESPGDADADNIYQLEIEVNDGDKKAQQTLQITVLNIDEVLPVINFSQTNVSVSEKDGIATLNIALDKANIQNNITASVNTVLGTASSSDYEALKDQTIILPAGETQLSFDITINNDELYEGTNTEFFTVLLSRVTGATLGSQSSATVTIATDDLPGLSVEDVIVNESKTVANVRVTLNTASVQPVQVNYATANDNAIAGTDYANKSGSLSFTPGKVSETINIDITDDAIAETDEQFLINLNGIVGAMINDGESLVTIRNDDSPSAPVLSLLNGDGQVTLFWADVTGATSYNIYFAEQSGVTPVSYESLGGVRLADKKSEITIPGLTNDSDYFFVVTALAGELESLESNQIGTQPQSSIATQYFVHENNSAITTLQARGMDSNNINFLIIGGADSSIFTLNSSGVLIFKNPPDFESPADADTDNVYQLEIQVSDGDITAHQILQITVLNIDEVLPVINFVNANVSVSETDAVATLNIKLDKADLQNNISVNVTTETGSAISNDYITLNNQLVTLLAGETQTNIDIIINNDYMYEGPNNESFSVLLSNVSGATLGSQSSVNITIIDDDEPSIVPPMVTVTSPENNQENVDTNLHKVDVTFDKNMAAASINSSTFRVLRPDDSVVLGSVSYDQSTKTASFNPSNNLINNVLYRIELSTDITDSNGASLATVFTSGFTTALPVVSSENISVNEESTNATLILSLDSPSGSPVTLDFATVNGSATEADDYDAQTGSITFNIGETEKMINLIIKNDEIYEADDTFTLNLRKIQGATLFNPNVQVVITDDDDFPSLSIEDVSKDESDAIATVKVTLHKASIQTVQVGYTTANSSAIAESDYIAKSGTLSFTPGEISETINFTIKDDAIAENDEQFLINLSNATGATISDTQSIITVRNDDAPSAPALSLLKSDRQVTLSWADVAGATSYNVYYARQSGVTPGNYAAMGGILELNRSSGLVLSNLKPWVNYHFVVTALANNLESFPSAEKSVRTVIVPLFPLNDTGVTYGASDSGLINTDCSGEIISQQDCSHGRDVTHNDDSDGHAGFSYTKLDSSGNDLVANAPSWDCVRDNVTGLTWEVKQASGSGDLRDSGWIYSWYNSSGNNDNGALGTPNGGHCFDTTNCDTEKFVAQVNIQGICGFKDWRLPSRTELRSLINLNIVFPVINTAYFPNSRVNTYWSSSPGAINSDSAWTMGFTYGIHSEAARSSGHFVRLVRSGGL